MGGGERAEQLLAGGAGESWACSDPAAPAFPQPPLPRLLAPVSFPAIGVRSGERTVLHQFPGPRDSNGVSCLSFVQAEAAMDESPSDVGHDHSSLRRIQGAVLTLGKPPHMLQESILPRGVHSLTRSEMGVSMVVLI